MPETSHSQQECNDVNLKDTGEVGRINTTWYKTPRNMSSDSLVLTHGFEDSDASIAVTGDGVVAHDSVVAGSVEHDAGVIIVVDNVVLDADIVASLGRDDTVVT